MKRNLNVIVLAAGAIGAAIVGKEIVKSISKRAHDQRMKDMPEGYYELKKEEARIKADEEKEERERKERLEMDSRERDEKERKALMESEEKRPPEYWLYKAAEEDAEARKYAAAKESESIKYVAHEGSWSDVQMKKSDNEAKKHEYSELRKTVEAAFVNRYTLPKDMKKDLGLKE